MALNLVSPQMFVRPPCYAHRSEKYGFGVSFNNFNAKQFSSVYAKNARDNLLNLEHCEKNYISIII
jgi:hypothetical protein